MNNADISRTINGEENYAGAARRPGSAGAVVFFDLDNTLIRGALSFHVGVRTALRLGAHRKSLLKFGAHHALFEAKRAEPEMKDIAGGALGRIKGLDEKAVQQATFDATLSCLHNLFLYKSVEILETHLEAGDECILITAAPQELADTVASVLGMGQAHGTLLERRDGLYTGGVIGGLLHGPSKAERARQLAALHGWDLEDAWAYSDSANDIPLLEAVGNPVAVNPSSNLRNWAEKGGHRVVKVSSRKPRAAGWAGAAALGALGAALIAAGLKN